MKRLYLIHSLTSVHIGSGSGTGFIDLPVVREATTGWPFAPGSAIKGVMADHHQASDAANRAGRLKMAFGTAGDEHASAGSLVFTDARLLCLPVRSLYGTFAWVTSRLALQRWLRDLREAGKAPAAPALPTVGGDGAATQALNATGTVLKLPSGKVVLQDLELPSTDNPAATSWATHLATLLFPQNQDGWKSEFVKRFVVVPDGVFDFLSETAMEVNAHIRLKAESKTVDGGALWYEESWPAETIVSGIVWCDRVVGGGPQDTQAALLDTYCAGEKSLQIGGKAGTGKGRVRMVFCS
jgi:CRISPR-associated protein Cmr4